MRERAGGPCFPSPPTARVGGGVPTGVEELPQVSEPCKVKEETCLPGVPAEVGWRGVSKNENARFLCVVGCPRLVPGGVPVFWCRGGAARIFGVPRDVQRCRRGVRKFTARCRNSGSSEGGGTGQPRVSVEFGGRAFAVESWRGGSPQERGPCRQAVSDERKGPLSAQRERSRARFLRRCFPAGRSGQRSVVRRRVGPPVPCSGEEGL